MIFQRSILPPLRLVSWQRAHHGSKLGFATIEVSTPRGPLVLADILVAISFGTRFVALPSPIAGGPAKYKSALRYAGGLDRFRRAVITLVERDDPEVFDAPALADAGDPVESAITEDVQ
jgi:hypothetical protein